MVLEDALREFQGTILVVSHDRYFLDRVCRRLLVFEGPRTRVVEGHYSDYKALLRQEQQAAEEEVARAQAAARKARQQAEREPAKKKSAGPAGPTLSEVEEQIGRLENELRILNQVLTRPEIYTNAEKVRHTFSEQRRLEQEIAALYETWETLAEEAG
jgi:ATP-binding cassette subfamily F protein 3